MQQCLWYERPLLVGMLVGLAACAPRSPASSPTPFAVTTIPSATNQPATATSAATATITQLPPTSAPTTTPTVTVEPQPTATTPPPSLVRLCPATPLVPIAALGLPDEAGLILRPETLESVWDETGVGLFLLTAEAETPERLTVFEQAGYVNEAWVRASPNGKWLLFGRKSPPTEKQTMWVASADGQQQWPLEVSANSMSARWLNDTAVLMFSAEVRWADLSIAEGADYYVVNPFTLEVERLMDLPPTQVEGLGGRIFQQGGKNYLLYQQGENYRLHDPALNTDQPVMQWLADEPAGLYDKTITLTGDGDIVVRMKRAYGLDVSDPLSVEALAAARSYTETMHPLNLPPAMLAGYAGLELVGEELSVVSTTAEGTLYVFDAQVGVIRQYCGTGLRGFSVDGRFAVFTKVESPSPLPIPKTSYVLNLETGYMSQIDGYEYIGWLVRGQ